MGESDDNFGSGDLYCDGKKVGSIELLDIKDIKIEHDIDTENKALKEYIGINNRRKVKRRYVQLRKCIKLI